jgi:signal transduction histidine kinase
VRPTTGPDEKLMPSVHLARRLHDTIAQRLTGLSYFLGEDGPAPEGAVERCRDEIHAAIGELRDVLESVGRTEPIGADELNAECEALLDGCPGVELAWEWSDAIDPRDHPLIESFLVEALRNVRKHARPLRVVVEAEPVDDAIVVNVVNDGVSTRRRIGTGMGSRLLALEAAAQGALADSAADGLGQWRQRLIVPATLAVAA